MKTYSNKSNALRAFKTIYPELALGLENAAIAERFLKQEPDAPVTLAQASALQFPKMVWAIHIPADVKVVKRHIYKGVQFRRRSLEPIGITSAVHDMFDEYQAEAEEADKDPLTRKQMIARAVRDGVAYYTARTQYQKWLRG